MANKWDARSVNQSFIKMPARDVTVLIEQSLPIDQLSQLFIEDIGGVELSQVSNYQTVYGTNQTYRTLSDLFDVTNEYNPGRYLLTEKMPVSLEFGLDYNDYYLGYTVASNGDIELNFKELPKNVIVEVELDADAIINIQERT